jgi:hypothetical protein
MNVGFFFLPTLNVHIKTADVFLDIVQIKSIFILIMAVTLQRGTEALSRAFQIHQEVTWSPHVQSIGAYLLHSEEL